ncbi:MAG: hypothetical protein F4Y49_09710 [Dehalococcoidia bacterium]|nr:hypothetical protein [Dehalococcoidia bacterium]
MALVLIAMGAIIGATAMYLYAEFSSGPDPVTKQAVRPIPEPTATFEAPAIPTNKPDVAPTPPEPTEPPATPTHAPENAPTSTAIPTRTPAVASAAPILPQIPFPTPFTGRTPEPDERPAALSARELDELPDALFLRQSEADTYHAIARFRWVSDGISSMESVPAQALIYLGLDAPQSARKLLRMRWMSDELSEDEAWAVGALAHLAFDAPGIFQKTVSMPWVADGISEDESWAITALSDLAMESGGAASWLSSYDWFADDINAEESMVVSTLGSISYETGSAAQFMGMQFLDSIEPGDALALGSLEFLAYETPEAFRKVLSHPTVADGITDQETTAIALLHDVQETNPDLVDTLLDPSNVQVERRTVRLPLAGDVELVIVRLQPGAPRSMDLLEDVVRFVEDYMGESFPTNFVLLFYADAVMSDFDGHNAGFNMTILPEFDSDDDSDEAYYAPYIIAHEVAHYYWNYSSQTWLDEGAAETMSIIYEETTTGQESWGAADTFPCPYAADLTGVERMKETEAEDCAYSLGTRFFLDLYRTLDEEEFRRGFRDLYLMGRDVFDPEDPEARSIDHVKEAFDFSEKARDEIIPKWYW